MRWPWSKTKPERVAVRWCGCAYPPLPPVGLPPMPDSHEIKRYILQDGRVVDRHFCPYKALFMDREYKKVELSGEAEAGA